jgi:glycosyltransferase involved in cell wall biosynthesis
MGAAHIVTFDADGQHDPADVRRMFEVLVESRADVALGSRFLGRAPGISVVRRALLKVATIFSNLTTGVSLTDTHNGLRLMTAAAARAIRIRQDGMAHASEIIEQIGKNHMTHVEVPVTVRYTEYSNKKGQSNLGSLGVLYDLLAGRLR